MYSKLYAAAALGAIANVAQAQTFSNYNALIDANDGLFGANCIGSFATMDFWKYFFVAAQDDSMDT